MPSNDSMLDIYMYENTQLLEKFESLLLVCEREEAFSADNVAEIFRILHTIKGSSAMMNFENVANVSHALEDLFGYLRENEARKEDFRMLSGLAFETMDTIKSEIAKIQNNGLPDGDLSDIIKRIKNFLGVLTNRKVQPAAVQQDTSKFVINTGGNGEGGAYYKAAVFFEKEARMENIRAFGIVKSLEKLCSKLVTVPADLFDEHADDEIVSNGFTAYIMSGESRENLSAKIRESFFIQKFDIEVMESAQAAEIFGSDEKKAAEPDQPEKHVDVTNNIKQNYMSVNLSKLDTLMDLVGEIVITESTVTKNPEVIKLKLESFDKASRQLRKLTDELQDIVMSIRMIPVSATFHKMERILRDMSAKTDKKARLVIIGEDTEVDKNVLDNLSDPLMHLVRNAMDHGIESPEDRLRMGKSEAGEIRLEARNTGGDIVIQVSDDGRGLDKEQLISKGIEKGLINKPASEISDKEAYSLIYAPGFSTKKEVTEFSGRGVGMDVVRKNIEKIGGSLSITSEPGHGMTMQIRIPLTLAIIDGMQVSVGSSSYIIPLLTIRESFKPGKGEVFPDPDGNEMIYIRENCYPVIRLYEAFGIDTQIKDPEDGILVTVESQSKIFCLLVDSLVGEHQTVVKPIPLYISNVLGDMKSIAGCTILGDGSISLILDINGLQYQKRMAV
jgi:two-component system, chemotaxis family, sensor kinase CheA